MNKKSKISHKTFQESMYIATPRTRQEKKKDLCIALENKSIGNEYFSRQEITGGKKTIFGFVFSKLHFHLPNQETRHEQDFGLWRPYRRQKMKVVPSGSCERECHWCQTLLPPRILYLFPARTLRCSENKAGSCFADWPLTFLFSSCPDFIPFFSRKHPR